MDNAPKHPSFLHYFKWTTIIVACVLVFLGGIGIGLGYLLTVQTEDDPSQLTFQTATVPTALPNGFYKGNTFTGLGKNWQGVVFNQASHSGTNKFNDGQQYSFTMSVEDGLRDDKRVVRLNYDQPGNTWWVHYVVEEIVQVAPNHYIGKMDIRISGLVFSVSYFELTQ